MGRFIVIVLDSFGVGAMDDVPHVRPQDIGANTCLHILQHVDGLELPTLRELGLMNALGEELGEMRYSPQAVYGTAELMHHGADTFYGHQEIMGTIPQLPLFQPFSEVVLEVQAALLVAGYEASFVQAGGQLLLTVDNCVAIGDNLETDAGQVYNVSGCLDVVSFEEIVAIARIVRNVARVSRVIALGGEAIPFSELIAAADSREEGRYAGIDTPMSGLYRQGYQVVHLGYGVDASVQLPTLLGQAGIDVSLIGKVADIVENPHGALWPGVETEPLFERLFAECERIQHGFICLNIQETDLAGHAEDVHRYANRLQVSDHAIGMLLPRLRDDDILIVTADHGNDPTIGHSRHTRENVPLLIRCQSQSPRRSSMNLGRLSTMSDLAATAAEYFNIAKPANGRSFLSRLR
ncbi:phosphopentomutase [Paenibacillus sp. strain BS8-2]